MLVHLVPLQYPKTPKSTPSNDAIEIPFTIGVDNTEMRRRTNAASSRTDNGVAGRNMMRGNLEKCRQVGSWDAPGARAAEAAQSMPGDLRGSTSGLIEFR
jgi:hypothetical protein